METETKSGRALADSSGQPVVWLLEDSRLQAQDTIAALTATCDVRHFLSGGELLEALSEARPDVLILDWELPDLSGLDVLRWVRQTHDRISLPVLMLTVREGPRELVEAFDAGANDFASKPYRAQELIARVATLVHVSVEARKSQQTKRELEQALAREEGARRGAQDERRELYEVLMRVPVAIALLRGPELVCEYANLAFERLVGGRSVIGLGLLEALPALRDTPLSGELRHLHRAGSTFSASELRLTLGARKDQTGFYNVELAPRRSADEGVEELLIALTDVTENVRARLRAEALSTELRVREAELREVTDALPVLVSHVTADERYGLVNRAYEDWFGVRREDLIGRHLVDVIGEAAYRALSPFVKRGLAGERFSFEQEAVPYRLGGKRDVRVDFVPRRGADGQPNGYVALLQDVSAERRAAREREELLKQAETARAQAQAERALQHHLFMQAPVAVAILEGDDLRFSFANPAYRKLVDDRDVVGKALREAVPEMHERGFDAILRRVMQTGEPFLGNELPWQLVGRSAQDSLVLSIVCTPKLGGSGIIDGVLMSCWDVTEQAHARARIETMAARLAQSEQQTRSVVEAAGAGLWSLDIAAAEVEVNERAGELMGLPVGVKIPLVSAMGALHPDDHAQVGAAVEAASRGKTTRFWTEFRAGSGPAQGYRWIESRAALVDYDGLHLAGAMIEVTERKILDAQREQSRALEAQLRETAERASRAKDEFMAMLGHELRNPLAPILTVLELMRARGETELARERALIERHARHMERLVEDLLDVSRIASGKVELRPERIDLRDMVKNAIEIATPLISTRRHELTVDMATEALDVDGDAARLTQVLSNLLTNAAKYTDVGGRIHVAATREEDTVTVAVSDSGRGIAKDMLPRVFELFSQETQNLDRSQGGLGLGLAIVKSLTELHGGEVSVHSDGMGQGSTFSVMFPLARRAAPTRPSMLPVRHALAGERKIRVLVVDDNEDAAILLAEALELRGCQVRCVHDAEEALEQARVEAPEVALLDIGLPGIDGYALARMLRERFAAEICLVALTGYGQPEDRQRSQEAGFDAHLVKPVSVDKVLRAVRELVARDA